MIKSALQTRVITLIEQGNLLSQPLFQQDDVKQQWLEKLRGRISFLIDHMAEAPIRADKGRVFEQLRAQLHQDLRHYFLDEYTYMGERQNSTRSESITAEVLQALLNAPKGYPNEPLITITHGIGGMILYDILTREQPDLHVDIWISVAPHYTFVESSGQIQRQVAQASTSQPSSSLEAVVGYWLHVADPSDFLSFQTPRFPQSIDEIQLTLPGMGTLKTHNTYFVSAQFYHLVREWIRPRLNLDRSSKQ
jgi:hypothetical protein